MKDQVWEDYCMGWAWHYWNLSENFSGYWKSETRMWLWLLVAAGAPL